MGFRVTHPNGAVEFTYLNPSSSDSDGTPNVFVYQGAAGNPAMDTPQHWYSLARNEFPEIGAYDLEKQERG